MSNRIKNRATGRASIITLVALLAALAFTSLIEKPSSANYVESSDETANAAASFVYTIMNPNGPNAIAAYRRDTATGELTFIGAFLTGGRGTGAIIDSQSPIVANVEGTRLYAVNPASNDISIMAIREDGSLEIAGAPVNSRGIEPVSLALHNDLLYVANKGNATTPPNYFGFRLTAGDQLTRVKNSLRQLNIGDDPGHVLFNADGSVLVGTRINGRVIDTFTVRRNTKYGRLRDVARLDNQPGPFGAAFNPAVPDQLVVSSVRLPGAAAYQVTSDGVILPINSVSNAPERAACWITVHPNGGRAWVTNTGSQSVSLYTIGASGAVTLAGTHSTARFGRLPFEVVTDKTGQFLYVLHVAANNPNILVLRVTDDNVSAGLQDVAAFPIPSGTPPMGLVVVDRD